MIVVFLHGEGTNRSIALVLDCQLSSTLHRDHSNHRSTLVLVAMQHLLPLPSCIGQYTYISSIRAGTDVSNRDFYLSDQQYSHCG